MLHYRKSILLFLSLPILVMSLAACLNRDPELESAANNYWNSFLTKCGDSYFTAYDKEFPRVLELRNLSIDTQSSVVSEADKLNGIEKRGVSSISAKVCRTLSLENPTQWSDNCLIKTREVQVEKIKGKYVVKQYEKIIGQNGSNESTTLRRVGNCPAKPTAYIDKVLDQFRKTVENRNGGFSLTYPRDIKKLAEFQVQDESGEPVYVDISSITNEYPGYYSRKSEIMDIYLEIIGSKPKELVASCVRTSVSMRRKEALLSDVTLFICGSNSRNLPVESSNYYVFSGEQILPVFYHYDQRIQPYPNPIEYEVNLIKLGEIKPLTWNEAISTMREIMIMQQTWPRLLP